MAELLTKTEEAKARVLADPKGWFRAIDKEWCVEYARLLAAHDAERARVAELEKLAFIGEHHFPENTYKARLAEALADRFTEAELREVANAFAKFVSKDRHPMSDYSLELDGLIAKAKAAR